MGRVIFVEALIRTNIEQMLARTLDPETHERWDLRFSTIKHLPKPNPEDPQRFEYGTRIGLGLRIIGGGESVAQRISATDAVSSLRFWSHDPKSLIREGSGYWKYTQEGDLVRFRTEYDYSCKLGAAGRAFDAILFRPLLAWATAWSFDRLRLWIERDVDPTLSAQRALTDAIARLTLAFIWLYHALIPKLLVTHPRELQITAAVTPDWAGNPETVVFIAGLLEILFAASYLLFWTRRWPYVLGLTAVLAATIPTLITSPQLFTEPFNPVTLVIAMVALSLLGIRAARDLPAASRTQYGRRKRNA